MFRLIFHEEFYKDIKKLDKTFVNEVWSQITKIKENPTQTKHLSGGQNCFRVRVRNYRLVYCVEKDVVYILIIAPRKTVYEKYLKRLYKIRSSAGDNT